MRDHIKRFFGFIRETFSEDGQGSFSRVIQGVIVVSTCGWITYLVLKTKAMPDLGGPSMFIGAGSLHYMTNKASDIVAAFRGNNPGNGQ